MNLFFLYYLEFLFYFYYYYLNIFFVEKRQNQRTDIGHSQTSVGKGLVVEPQYALVISLIYIGFVIILHMIDKFRKDNTVTPPS